MTTSKLQTWLYVQLTMKSSIDGSTSTYYFSNRAIIDDVNTGRYIPILKSVGNMGTKLADYLPQQVNSQIVLDNSPGSFSYERRFSDLLERESPVSQTISLYIAQTDLTDLNVTADFVLAWSATVTGVSVNKDTATIRISSVSVPAPDVGKVITATEFTTAPSKSLGQVLPLVIGSNVQLKPVQIDPDGDASPAYAYALTYGTQYPNGGVQAYYAKNLRGNYTQVLSASAVGSTVYSANAGGSNTYTAYLAATEVAWRFQNTTARNYVMVKASLACIGTSFGGTVDGQFILRLYSHNLANNSPGDLICEARRNQVDFSGSLAGSATFTIDFSLPKPIVLESDQVYYVSIEETVATGFARLSYQIYGLHGTAVVWIKDGSSKSGATGNWYPTSALTYDTVNCSFYGVKFTDTPAAVSVNSSNGYGHSTVELTQTSAAVNMTAPILTDIDFIVEILGLQDSSGGTLTGSANANLKRALYCLKLLDLEWNGSTWTGGKFNFAKYTSTHTPISTGGSVPRELNFHTQGKQNLSTLYSEICRHAAARITLHNNASTPLAVYAWGTTITSSATLTDEDTEITNIEFLGVETVINRPQIRYKESLVYQSTLNIAQTGETTNLIAAYEYYNGQSSYVSSLTAMSETLYGPRQLDNVNFPWLVDATTAQALAEFYVRVYAYPHVYVVLETPYFRYSSLDMFDVVTLIHPDLPAYFGTSANASKPTYQGTPVDLWAGDYPKRANGYRAQIEGREIFFDQDLVPKLRLTVRLLLNSPNDPT